MRRVLYLRGTPAATLEAWQGRLFSGTLGTTRRSQSNHSGLGSLSARFRDADRKRLVPLKGVMLNGLLRRGRSIRKESDRLGAQALLQARTAKRPFESTNTSRSHAIAAKPGVRILV